MNNRRGRGRPQGGTTARADILEAARRRFLADGYDRVTVRSIAAEAGVDPALINYYFRSKKGLFGATMALVANPAELLAMEIPGPLNNLPERLVRTVLATWEDPASGGSLHGFLHAVVRDPEVARVFREVIEQEMLTSIADRIGGPDAKRRAAIASSHIAGLVMSRYVLQLEPLASMPRAEVIERMAPSLRAALLGPAPRRYSSGTEGPGRGVTRS